MSAQMSESGAADVPIAAPTTAAVAPDLLGAWARAWVNRARPYAAQRPDGTYRWVNAACGPDELAAHLAGEVTLALAATDARGWARWACLDCDQDDPEALPRLVALRAALAGLGLPAVVEASRRGGHVWILAQEPLPAGALRFCVFEALRALARAGVAVPELELYPSTDAPGGLGQAVRLPLGVHRLTGARYPLLDDAGRPLAFPSPEAAVGWLLGRPRLPARLAHAAYARLQHEPGHGVPRVVRPAALRHTPTGEGSATGQADGAAREGPGQAGMGTRMGTRSAVIRWVDAYVAPAEILDALAPEAELRRAGRGSLGWCPFHDDRAPDAAGRPGTPSFYVVENARYGWSWRCLSSNCAQHDGPMRHSFRLWQLLLGTDAGGAIRAALARWPQAAGKATSDVGEEE